MGRKSTVEKILNDLEDIGQVKGLYLVYYEYKNPLSRFYKNLHELTTRLEDGEKAGKRIILCTVLHTAFAVRDLLNHYGAEKVVIYRTEEIE